MTTLRSFIGFAAALVAFGCVYLGARAARRRFVGSLSGAPAQLADAVMVLSVGVVVAQVLGSFSLMRVVPLTVVLIVVGVGGMRIGAAVSPAVITADSVNSPDVATARVGLRTRAIRFPAVVAAGGCGLITALWIPRVLHVYRAGGPTTIDSLWYHLPVAAGFAQSGNVLDPVFVSGQALETYYPHTTELFHALGMVFLAQDTLTPFLNVAWLVVALVAAWCIGRPFGAAPLTLIGALLVVAGPQLVTYEAGQGLNDIFGIALTLAAIAILMNTWRSVDRQAAVVWAGLAMGLAVSSKYTLLGVGLALTIGVVAVTPRGARTRTAALWTGALTLTGVYWYLRNLIAMGNPIPEVDVSIGGLKLPSVHVEGVSTVWKVLHRAGNWDAFIKPGFRYALGPVWWALLAVAVVGLLVGAARRDSRVRFITFVGAVGVIVFVFSPQALGFFGGASFFGSNVRYVAVPLALGILVLAIGFGTINARAADVTAVVFAIGLIATQVDQLLWPFDGKRPSEFGLPVISHAELAVGIAVGALVAVAALVAASTNVLAAIAHVPRALQLSGVVLSALALLGGFVVLDRFYVARRYEKSPFLTNVYRWAERVEDKRIGYLGTTLQYPLTGKGVSNNVQYIENRISNTEAKAITTCPAWRREINRERLDFVVVTTPGFPVPSLGKAPQIAWTQTDPNAKVVAADRIGQARALVYEITGPMTPSACPGLRKKQP